jgi:hypothetical protein
MSRVIFAHLTAALSNAVALAGSAHEVTGGSPSSSDRRASDQVRAAESAAGVPRLWDRARRAERERLRVQLLCASAPSSVRVLETTRDDGSTASLPPSRRSGVRHVAGAPRSPDRWENETKLA